MSYRNDDRRGYGGGDRRDDRDRSDRRSSGGGYGGGDRNQGGGDRRYGGDVRRDDRRDDRGGRDGPRDGGRDRFGGGGRHGGSDRFGGGGRRDDRGGGGGRGAQVQSEKNIFAEKGGERRRSARERRENSSEEDESPLPMYQRRRESLWDRMEAPDTIEVNLQTPSGGMNPVLKRQQRRLYFGNIPSHVNEQELMDFVNNTMISSGTITQKGNPVQSVVINREKAYAFVEFRSDEESSIGMGLDGITIQGQILRVRRPKDFNEGLELTKPVQSVVSAHAGESPHKIYMGNIPTSLGEGDVKKLLSMFGQLRSFNLVRDSLTGLSKGFAFCEFADITVTDAACKALHQMVIGDKTLVCQRASVQLASRVAEENTVLVDPRAAAMLTLSAPTASLLAAAIKDEEVKPTRILVLLNVLDITDFPGDKIHEEYDELYSDMMDFFAQFGKVNKILIPRPLKKIVHDSIEHFDFRTYIEDEEDDNNSDDEEAMKLPGFGKVFVEFEELKDAQKAQETLVGLRYNGRMAITSFLSEDKWYSDQLEPDNLSETSMVRMLKPDMSKYA